MWAFFQAITVYWRTLFAYLYPIVLSPVFLVENVKEYRCLYILLLMAGYWISECLPLGITGLIPMVLGPVMGISDSSAIGIRYLDDTNMMFIAGLILAISIEASQLHRRLAINFLILMGSNIRLLHFGLVLITFFLSMWISNTAAVALMCPIIEATLLELEDNGVLIVYSNRTEINPETGEPYLKLFWKPTRITIGFFLSAAYAASIGGMATVVGSGTNIAFKGIFETEFPRSPGVSFDQWISLCLVMVIVKLLLVWVYMQMLYLGFGRPNSKDAQMLKMTPEGKAAVKLVLKEKRKQLGPMSFREIYVAFTFSAAVILWLFKDPSYMAGWGAQIKDYIVPKRIFKIGDSTAGFIPIIFLFIIPADFSFFRAFSKDPEKRPTTVAIPVLSWDIVKKKMGWNMILLLGSGFALSVLTRDSGLNKKIGNGLKVLKDYHWFVTVCIGAAVGSIISEITSNVAVANITLPIFAQISRTINKNPYYLMYPVGLACSHAFLLPVGTPPNAIVSTAANIPTLQMVIAGLGVNVICFVILVTFFPIFALALGIKPDDFPEWAQ